MASTIRYECHGIIVDEMEGSNPSCGPKFDAVCNHTKGTCTR